MRQKGFTLIEMIVVIVVIAMITGVSMSNFRAGEKRKRAVIAVDAVINAIRNAQNFTLTGKNTNNPNAACRVPQYYFITFTYASTYILSALDNCGNTDQIESYTLPVNTRFKASGLILDGSVAATNLTFVFYPPFGAIKAGKDSSAFNTFTTGTIAVETTDGNVTKTTRVDGVAGRIGE